MHVGSDFNPVVNIYDQILLQLKNNRSILPNYKTAKQTVKAIQILENYAAMFARENLTSEVNRLTGLTIHAPENYPRMELFQQAVLLAVKSLQQAFARFHDPQDEIQFYRVGLHYNGCFEARVEEIVDYLENSESLAGRIKLAIYELNLSRDRIKFAPVPLDELITFLQNKSFFTINSLDEQTFAGHPAVKEFQAQRLIEPSGEKDVMERLAESISTYDKFGSGPKVFMDYLIGNGGFTQVELNNLENHLNDYFAFHPDQKAWI